MNQSLNGSSYARSMNGLNSINADSIDTSTLVCTELDTVTLNATGLTTLNNLNVTGYENLSGDLNAYGNIKLDTVGKYLEFPDGSQQQTAAIAQGVGVVRGYLNAFDTTTQTNVSTSAENIMKFNTVDSYNQIHIVNDASANPTKITFDKTGAYLIIISLLVQKSDAGLDEIYVWFSKNGVNIANSNSELHLEKNDATGVLTINFGLNVVAGDYVQIKWFSIDSAMILKYEPAQVLNGVSLPGAPSVILSVEETNSVYNSLQTVDVSGDRKSTRLNSSHRT